MTDQRKQNWILPPTRYTKDRAIRILGEAARTDGQVLVAAERLGMFPTKASLLALQAFYGIHQDPWRQKATCGAAESAMRAGWLP